MKRRDAWVVCSRCGQQREKRHSLGFNGRWLCGECLADRAALNAFMEERFASVATAIRGIREVSANEAIRR